MARTSESPASLTTTQASVISLLSLARPFGSKTQDDNHRRTMSLLEAGPNQSRPLEEEDEFSYDDYLMASRCPSLHPKRTIQVRRVAVHRPLPTSARGEC